MRVENPIVTVADVKVNGCDNFNHKTFTKHSKSKSRKVEYFLRLRSKVDLKNVTVLVLSSTYGKSLKGTNTGLT